MEMNNRKKKNNLISVAYKTRKYISLYRWYITLELWEDDSERVMKNLIDSAKQIELDINSENPLYTVFNIKKKTIIKVWTQ